MKGIFQTYFQSMHSLKFNQIQQQLIGLVVTICHQLGKISMSGYWRCAFLCRRTAIDLPGTKGYRMKNLSWHLIAAIAIALCCCTATSADPAWRSYEWVITIETEEISKAAIDAEDGLDPIAKANVTYGKIDGGDSVDYEKLWFCKGKTFGIERQAALDLGRGKAVAIKVVHKGQTPSQSEVKAAAKSILRILLDLRLTGNMLQTVIVPDQTFSPISDELTNEHFAPFVVPVGAPFHLTASLFLQNQSASRNQLLYYVPKRTSS
jgi:hypothetical protein